MIGNITSSSFYSTFSLSNLLSILAIIISIFGYLITKKNVQINAKNIEIVLKKENERKELQSLLSELNSTSIEIKKIPEYIYFAMPEFIPYVIGEVYENGNLDLEVEFIFLDMLDEKIPINSVSIEDIRSIYKNQKKIIAERGTIYGYEIIFKLKPETDKYCGSIFFEDTVAAFKIICEADTSLRKYEFVIESFVPDFFELLEASYKELTQIFYDTISKKSFCFTLNRDMKPSEIQDIIMETLNQNLLIKKSSYYSVEIGKRIDNLRIKLNEKIW